LIKEHKKILEEEREIFSWDKSDFNLPDENVEYVDPTGLLQDYLDSRGVFWNEFFDPIPPQGKKLIVCNNITLKENFSPLMEEILDRTKKGFSNILLINTEKVYSEKLISILKRRKILPKNSEMISLNGHWFGGWEFVKRSHIFYGLPNPAILNWEYEAIIAPWGYTEFRGDVIAGLCNAPPEMGVVAGVTNYGKGKIIFCNFNLINHLGKNSVADLVFSRFVKFCLGIL